MKAVLLSSLCLGVALAAVETPEVPDFSNVFAGDDKGKKGGKDGKGGKGEEDEEDVARPVMDINARWS